MKNIIRITLLPSLVAAAMAGDAVESKTDAHREKLPDKCVVKTYELTSYGTPDIGLKKPQNVIEVDPSTGEGKVYKPDIFGNADKFSAPVGEVRKTSEGELTVYSYSSSGLIDTLHPKQVINVEKNSSGTSGEGKIFGVNQWGLKESIKPVGAVTVECE